LTIPENVLKCLISGQARPDFGGISVKNKNSGLLALYHKYRELVNYIIFGGITTLVNWVSYSICEGVFGLSLRMSGVISWVVAVVLVAFVTNKLWVFGSKSWKPALVMKEFVTFIGGRILTGIIEIEAVPRLVDWGFDETLFGVEGLPAKILISVVVVILNYIFSKFISFRTANGGENEDPGNGRAAKQ